MTDKNSAMYDAANPMLRKAVDELIKKKIVIQANHAQKLYS